MAVHLAVADDVFASVLFCAVLFHTRCLGFDLGLIESVSEDFSYLLLNCSHLLSTAVSFIYI